MSKLPDKTCPECAEAVPYYNDRCYSCGYSYAAANVTDSESDSGPPPAVVVWSYPGRTQADAAVMFARHAQTLAAEGYVPVSQSWADGRPGVGRVFAIGVFADAIRPDGYLTVTYQRREDASAVVRGGGDILDQIRKLGELKDAGYLTAGEFDAKKADLLQRL